MIGAVPTDKKRHAIDNQDSICSNMVSAGLDENSVSPCQLSRPGLPSAWKRKTPRQRRANASVWFIKEIKMISDKTLFHKARAVSP